MALLCLFVIARVLVGYDNRGTWNGITERDGEEIRRVATLLRFFGGLGTWH
jgi:hypothetical protein